MVVSGKILAASLTRAAAASLPLFPIDKVVEKYAQAFPVP